MHEYRYFHIFRAFCRLTLRVKKLIKTFQELGIDVETTKALKENGYEDPFPIQQEAIPLMLKGIDVIGQAHTGTGKTAAFALPILTKIKRRGPIQALILVPTPGRLIDHIKQGSIDLENVKFVVLDEADRMLDMGFIDDIKFILFYVNEDRQTCLFSATMPPEILRLAQEYMKEFEEVRLNEEELSLDTIEQSYLVVYEKEKFKHLCNLIRMRDKKQTIVFAATKQRTHRLASELKQEGFKAVTMHGDLSQGQRDNAMYKFRKGFEDILVATDIAARGIDVPAVGHVINYDIPADPLIYFHRIGRTARAGGAGKAISLVSQDRVDDFGRILKTTERPIRKLNEEMGIEIPVIQQYVHRDYRQRRGGSNYRGYGNTGYNNGYRNQTFSDNYAPYRSRGPRYGSEESPRQYTGGGRAGRSSRYGTSY